VSRITARCVCYSVLEMLCIWYCTDCFFFSTNATVVIVCVEIYVVLCSGAFKIRGASNSIFALDYEQASKGVVTHSRFGASFNVLFAIFPDIGRTEWY